MNENNQGVTPHITARITWMNPDAADAKRAVASIRIADAFIVHGLSVFSGKNGLFVMMPTRASERNGSRRYIETAHPVTAECRDAINKTVLGAYSQAQALALQNFVNGNPNPSVPNEQFEILPVPPIPKEETDALPFPYEDPDSPTPDPMTDEEAPDENEVPIFGQML